MVTLTYGWEPLRTVFAEPNWLDLIREHHEELGVHKDAMPLDPDYERCLKLEEVGVLRAWIARSPSGAMAGYLAWFIQPHLHYRSTITAVEDLFLLSAPYRRGLNGYRLFSTNLAALRERGVRRCIVHTKVHWNAERAEHGVAGMDILFKRLGFVHTDNLWSMML